ncbi:MAG: HNH endonuclease [Thioalkalivibrionaceae bacterium]
MMPWHQQILRTDASGMPLEWIDYQQAVRLFCQEQVAYTLGQTLFRVRGGINARSGLRSSVEIPSIVATHGTNLQVHKGYTPPLNNPTLFRRDQHLCLYCGDHFPVSELSRDHVHPVSQGGVDTWMNVVTACKRCNNHKAGRTPEQAGMALLAIPFVPTHAEYVYLKGRRVLADQMEFLKAHFPRRSRLRDAAPGSFR